MKNTSNKGNDDLIEYNAILDGDSGGNYGLEGRLVLRRPTPVYTCSKEGRVVVSIKVDRSGKVVSATPGAKGSTTTNPCLLNRAKEAALNTKWQAEANAPEKQIGKIVYNFSLR
ncbi:MAG: hypothetical protein HRT69_01315 [Flavobacteriaceae bacterium]|nr:hypothetical protein [Flavobacteriaceae bacterium]